MTEAVTAGPRAAVVKGAPNPADAHAGSVGCGIFGLIVLFFAPGEIWVRAVVLLLYLAVGVGIWRWSRIAAVVGLVFACANFLSAVVFTIMSLDSGHVIKDTGPLTMVLVFNGLWIKLLIDSVRATFAYHRYLAAGGPRGR